MFQKSSDCGILAADAPGHRCENGRDTHGHLFSHWHRDILRPRLPGSYVADQARCSDAAAQRSDGHIRAAFPTDPRPSVRLRVLHAERAVLREEEQLFRQRDV